MELKEAIRILRLELNITQNELADRLHVSFMTVNRWENGRTCPNRSTAVSIIKTAVEGGASENCVAALRDALEFSKRRALKIGMGIEQDEIIERKRSDSGKSKVLIAEDESINRRILSKILESKYDILEAKDGKEALSMIVTHRDELSAVLMDIDMPEMDGFEILSKIRETHITDDLPVIITTADQNTGSEKKGLSLGAWDYVTKPYDAQILLNRMEKAISHRQVSAYDRMLHMVEHDELTGLYNRKKVFSEIKNLLMLYPDKQFVMVRLDIDSFALYNASFGEERGNALLCYLATQIKERGQSLEHYLYGRLNADVFCVAYEFPGNFDCLEKEIEVLQKKMGSYDENYRIEISAGVCIMDSNDINIDEYFFRTTVAVQACKKMVDKHISYYNEKMGHKINDEMSITSEMKQALEEGQFKVYLQPKINLITERECGAEALARWEHPKRGMISPGSFIPIFENNGFISKLDFNIWEQTCKALSEWINEGKEVYPVSVNLSRVSMYNPNLVEDIDGLVKKYNLPPKLLQLEITESAYMSNPDLMKAVLSRLHEHGFTILMDDFGSGYSSLNTLKEIDVDILKIDMKFLPVGDDSEKAEIILSCVIRMANWLGMNVVVEGVENKRQRDFLEGAGCTEVQGYYYSKPIPVNDFKEEYVKHRVADEEVTEPHTKPMHNMDILIVDDNEIDRIILNEMFKEQYRVRTCESCEEALAYLKSNASSISLILLDDIMPGMSGMEFLRYCKQDEVLSIIPKIMVTASSSVDEQVEAFESGAYDYIVKPFTREVVEARVNHVMDISSKTTIFDVLKKSSRSKSEQDPATGLLNKIVFKELSTHIIESMPDEWEALMVIDIDNFKSINDVYGHLVGDAVIKLIADELNTAFRKTDALGRFGGDEFVVLMTRIPDMNIVKRKVTELITTITGKCKEKMQISVSVSVGIADTDKGITFDKLFERADSALYEAKKNGRGRYMIYGEKVPPIVDDNKPVVLICGSDVQLYSTLALAYGSEAAFCQITSFDALKDAFEKYRSRICVACLDASEKVKQDSDEFYQYIMDRINMGISIIGTCKEGDVAGLREALKLNVDDIIFLPPQPEVVKRRLGNAIMAAYSME